MPVGSNLKIQEGGREDVLAGVCEWIYLAGGCVNDFVWGPGGKLSPARPVFSVIVFATLIDPGLHSVCHARFLRRDL